MLDDLDGHGFGHERVAGPVSDPNRPRGWQRMLSGRRLDLLDPLPSDIELDDIAHGLARVARWNGQTIGPHVFSVAQHSLFVEAIAAELEPGLGAGECLTALLHDAAEYVMGDLITPLKSVVGPAYGALERRLLAAVHLRFGLPEVPAPELRRLIKRADKVAACLEATHLAGFSKAEAEEAFGLPEIVPAGAESFLVAWSASRAGSRFRQRAAALWAEAGAPCQERGEGG